RPISAAPPTAAYRAKKFIRRNRVAVLAAALIFAALLASSIVSTVFAIRAARAGRLAQRRLEEAQAVNDFLTQDVIGSASPLVTQGNREMTLREALDNSARAVTEKFHDRPLIEASVRDSVASAYRSLGRSELALPHAQQ